MGAENVPHRLLYLLESPPEFQRLADAHVVLIDAGGLKLPIHSVLLCQTSSFFCNLFKSHEGLNQSGLVSVPLPETSLKEAQDWLCFVYMPHTVDPLRAESYLATVKLLHKFEMTRVLQRCDAHLAQQVASVTKGLRKHLWVSCLPIP
jgi:hypothetical protein